ncbi:MAG: hypothetical protein U0228_15795 [Myxococcaceae bacterium]
MMLGVACSGPTSSGTGGGGGSSGGGTGGGTGGGSTTGGGSATGGGTGDCLFLVNCASQCADTDQPCRDACGTQSTTLAITQYNALMDCSNGHACADTACVNQYCSAELTACRGSSGTGGGGGTTGLTTSGKCEVQFAVPNVAIERWCWDYTLTVSTNHNDGNEHWFYYDAMSASSGQSTCASSNNTFTAQQPGPWNDATISATNLNQKRSACQQQGNVMYTTATFTEGAACSSSGSLGHCTMTVTNVWNPSTTDLTATTTGTWSVP